ncbi:membrane-associated protein, putative [Bodo saltans]|uniref:Membrane-associated protein, putative n=1 Tax=Bodo saltans TaxID=75058 RepID=A0A0S4J523_BODSA|nr:membrane-associated protein, putative [Bodo saltans]|eukprot:CUG25880.1 membrane-associated protein, putative [Bodo saltans]
MDSGATMRSVTLEAAKMEQDVRKALSRRRDVSRCTQAVRLEPRKVESQTYKHTRAIRQLICKEKHATQCCLTSALSVFRLFSMGRERNRKPESNMGFKDTLVKGAKGLAIGAVVGVFGGAVVVTGGVFLFGAGLLTTAAGASGGSVIAMGSLAAVDLAAGAAAVTTTVAAVGAGVGGIAGGVAGAVAGVNDEDPVRYAAMAAVGAGAVVMQRGAHGRGPLAQHLQQARDRHSSREAHSNGSRPSDALTAPPSIPAATAESLPGAVEAPPTVLDPVSDSPSPTAAVPIRTAVAVTAVAVAAGQDEPTALPSTECSRPSIEPSARESTTGNSNESCQQYSATYRTEEHELMHQTTVFDQISDSPSPTVAVPMRAAVAVTVAVESSARESTTSNSNDNCQKYSATYRTEQQEIRSGNTTITTEVTLAKFDANISHHSEVGDGKIDLALKAETYVTVAAVKVDVVHTTNLGTARAHGEVEVGAQAAAGAAVKGDLREGMLNAQGEAKAGAGVTAEGDVSLETRHGKAAAKGGVTAGVGAGVSGAANVDGKKVEVQFATQVALGVGFTGETKIAVDVGAVQRDVAVAVLGADNADKAAKMEQDIRKTLSHAEETFHAEAARLEPRKVETQLREEGARIEKQAQEGLKRHVIEKTKPVQAKLNAELGAQKKTVEKEAKRVENQMRDGAAKVRRRLRI